MEESSTSTQGNPESHQDIENQANMTDQSNPVDMKTVDTKTVDTKTSESKIPEDGTQHDETLASSKGDGPATILVMPYYRAQLQAYQQAFDQLVTSKQVTVEEAKRVKFATLDSSQGDEADLCIIDYTKTQSPGFCGDLRRQCLTLTRSRQCEIIILNRGMFSNWDADPKVEPRAKVLRRLYDDVNRDGAVIRIPTCLDCQNPNAGHDTCENGKVKSKCGQCKDSDHDARNCPRRYCFNCGQSGHRTNECEEPMACCRCGGKDHIVDDCDNVQRCLRCRKPGHYELHCNLCRYCYSDEHIDDDCAVKPCKLCKGIGHNEDSCPTKTCRRCQQPGHMAKDCSQPHDNNCRTCGEPGHFFKDCPKKERFCLRCGEKGHIKRECLKTAEECSICRHCEEKGHFARNCPERKLCSKCGSTNHVDEHCVTGVHCSLCSSDEHASADCRALKIICGKCYGFGHLKADCRANREPRYDGKVPRTGLNSLQPSAKTERSCKSLTTEFTRQLHQMLSTDDNAGSWGNDWPVETAADPSTGVESANDWSVEPGTKEDKEW